MEEILNKINNETLVIIALAGLTSLCIVTGNKDGMLLFGGGLTGYVTQKK